MGLLRLLLALSVVLAHAGTFYGFDLVGGKAAVETFFIISGFYMALVLTEKYGQIVRLRQRLTTFYSARLLRLYPTYVVAVVLTLVADRYEAHRVWELIKAEGASVSPASSSSCVPTCSFSARTP